ncbi:Hypothetical protein IALB_3176 [Ignavibacterium album JCM 16511]|uniref:Tetratricopeptide repeat protein n=1 Tax=Ignavibacterium album (strain DSM 19864 / JCM 16511 / NBRC 101810 / Mat9-16) TaxID=945713 RepID=I0APH2_IGNAJ|nr:hypothetical protein [Ignavibacterium album]AFH50879.1 Hypothetical protein IALB_3176 [Ignavibacterium album JCM 16511]
MIEIEKIIELLEKKDLNDSEKSWLKDISASDAEAKKIIETYTAVKNSLNRNEHLDEELLGEYILYKNGSDEYSKVVLFLLSKIEDHLRKCEICLSNFKELNLRYADVNEFVSKSISPETEKSYTPITQIIFREKFNSLRYAAFSLASVVFIYVGLLVYSNFTTPDYLKTPFAQDRDFYNTRGRTSELFQRGLDALDRKDFDTAIKYLNDDLKENPDQQSIFYTHFVLGLAYVNKAEKNFLGLFKSFDREDVLKAISHFEKSIELNQNERFQNLKLDAHFYIGKAYLLINDRNSAKHHLQIVVDEKGSYYKNAKELLKSF